MRKVLVEKKTTKKKQTDTKNDDDMEKYLADDDYEWGNHKNMFFRAFINISLLIYTNASKYINIDLSFFNIDIFNP